ncbi:MAG: hypothetical protein LBI28_06890 [Treponema sp.]|jgi:hypothetical protein|nr:hypothetical protein [Treponema sp.]
MKERITLFIFMLFVTGGNIHLSAQLTVSGLLDSTVYMQAGAGDSPAFSCGIEEYANLRFQSRIRDRAVVYGAVNLIAVTGNNAVAVEQISKVQTHGGISSTSYTDGANYIAAIELERLYFRLNGEYTNFDGGLFRLPFGFGQVYRPSDFLNPANPLKPDARLRAVLGASFAWYPIDELKLLVFYAAPQDPFAQDGNGTRFGVSLDHHWDKASVQALYAYEMPNTETAQGIHRAGLSLKADIEVGLVMDALYTYNNATGTELEGLSFSIGADYSFFGGDLIVLAEYLYNGPASSTSRNSGGNFSNENYLYTGLTFRFSDFTNMSVALITGFDDVSFTPMITLNHDLFQGATLTITAMVPLDRDLFYGDGRRGEFGPIRPESSIGRYFDFSARLRLRF